VSSLKGYKPDSPRWPVLRNGIIFFKDMSVACFILNRSRGGAGIVLQSEVDLPLVFDLEIDGENMRRRCVAIWHDQCHIGVSFDMDRITQAASDDEAIEVQAPLAPLLPEKEHEQSWAGLLSVPHLVAPADLTKTAVMTSTEAAVNAPEQPEIPNRYKDRYG
jgi:hypothetical protein